MIQFRIQITGMACGMCEAHINDALRKAFPLKKVTSSYRRKEAILLTEHELADADIKAVIEDSGYALTQIERQSYEKKRRFPFGR